MEKFISTLKHHYSSLTVMPVLFRTALDKPLLYLEEKGSYKIDYIPGFMV